MRINIISERGWILRRCADELATRLLNVTVNDTRTADLEYYIPYWKVQESARRKIGFFTHGFNRAVRFVGVFEGYIAMNRHMANVLRNAGAQNVTVIRPGTERPNRPPTFGVVGRTYADKRKGKELVQKAVEAGFRIRACGPGPWPCPIVYDIDHRDNFYSQIDYLLVPSLDEGGPVPLLEAIAHHIPVIAPDVGWCWEFPVIRYEKGNWESLVKVLSDLTFPPTWEEWALEHARFFQELAA